MKRYTLLIIALALLFTGCGGDGTASTADVANLTGLDITGSIIISSQDSHGGLNGDGELTIVYDCTKIRESVEAQMAESWNVLPLTDNLQMAMYGSTKDEVCYSDEPEDGNNIPRIDSGYYYFINRQDDSQDDTFLFYSASFNFILFLYDADTARLYYYKLDT